MRGDLGSPLVRAVVRGERVKRRAGPVSPLWRRWTVIRARLIAQMTDSEFRAAWSTVECESDAWHRGRGPAR